MPQSPNDTNESFAAMVLPHTGKDLMSGLVVFLVALPLCLGIALASGAPLFSGIIAGIVGGIVVGGISQSRLSVAGPAAGLTAIVLTGITQTGSYEAFLVAVVLAGIMQVGLGLAHAGGLGSLVPTSVIRGMLAAIGLILVLKQIPHAIGYDVEAFGSEQFSTGGGETTFSLLGKALGAIEPGAVIISLACFAILWVWGRPQLKKMQLIPGALMVVVVGTVLNMLFSTMAPSLYLGASHLVSLPELDGFGGFIGQLTLPDFSQLTSPAIYTIAITICLVASIETMLNVEAIDKLDPSRRTTPQSRELLAQGIGNSISGLMGGLPVTSVIVRSTANLNAGGKTKMAAVYHGIFLLVAVVFLAQFLNFIPLASLAVILLQVGYKLVSPTLIKRMYGFGWDQFVPFIVTVGVAVVTDLLRGVLIGLVVGIIFVLRSNANRAFSLVCEGGTTVLKFNKDTSFIHRPALKKVFRELKDGSLLVIDGSQAEFIDFDIKEEVQDFLLEATDRNIEVDIRGIRFRADGGKPGAQPDRDFDAVVVESPTKPAEAKKQA